MGSVLDWLIPTASADTVPSSSGGSNTTSFTLPGYLSVGSGDVGVGPVSGMQPLAAPGSTNPLDTQTVKVNGQDYTARDVLEWTQALAATPDDPEYNAFMDTSRNIVRGYGFRTGALGTEESVRNIQNPAERMKYVIGNDNGTAYTGQLLTSIDNALSTDTGLMSERQGIFTNHQVSRTMVDGTTRTIDITFNNPTGLAQNVGVSQAEALAKTDWRVWENTLNAAFATNGINDITINGAWRPYRGMATYAGTLYGNLPASEQTRGVTTWQQRIDSSPHNLGRGLDIGAVNGIVINNESGRVAQDALVKEFSYNLRNIGGASQVIQPWMTVGLYGVSSARPTMGDEFVRNAGHDLISRTDLEQSHLNHLHVSYFW